MFKFSSTYFNNNLTISILIIYQLKNYILAIHYCKKQFNVNIQIKLQKTDNTLKISFKNIELECGTDEAGRGCIAGPVTACALIMEADFWSDRINDSKKLTTSKRLNLKQLIEDNCISFSVQNVYETEIDTINILNASIKAMHLAIEELNPQPGFIIVDGNKFKPYKQIPYETIVKGDSKFLSIAAASILAKTYRDEYMCKLHEEYPMYNWKQNKGYPTKEHREAVRKYGITKYHRKSFKILPNQTKLDL